MVPLYTPPGDVSWTEVIGIRKAHPSVPLIAVVNPSDGPGPSRGEELSRGMADLRRVGVTVLGYVHTSYTERSRSSAEADVRAYRRWYELKGVMIDEMSNTRGDEGYYSALSRHAKSLGMTFAVGNPGTEAPASFTRTVDCLVIHEDSGPPPLSLLRGYGRVSPSHLAYISHSVPALDVSFERRSASLVGWLYITDAKMPNPYDRLPSYFDEEVRALETT